MTQSKKSSTKDFTITDSGSIVLLHPQTDAARNWLEENIGQDNGFQPYWPTVVVEPRFVQAIIEGFSNDGLLLA